MRSQANAVNIPNVGCRWLANTRGSTYVDLLPSACTSSTTAVGARPSSPPRLNDALDSTRRRPLTRMRRRRDHRRQRRTARAAARPPPVRPHHARRRQRQRGHRNRAARPARAAPPRPACPTRARSNCGSSASPRSLTPCHWSAVAKIELYEQMLLAEAAAADRRRRVRRSVRVSRLLHRTIPSCPDSKHPYRHISGATRRRPSPPATARSLAGAARLVRAQPAVPAAGQRRAGGQRWI